MVSGFDRFPRTVCGKSALRPGGRLPPGGGGGGRQAAGAVGVNRGAGRYVYAGEH
jgi:hypothetical protein